MYCFPFRGCAPNGIGSLFEMLINDIRFYQYKLKKYDFKCAVSFVIRNENEVRCPLDKELLLYLYSYISQSKNRAESTAGRGNEWWWIYHFRLRSRRTCIFWLWGRWIWRATSTCNTLTTVLMFMAPLKELATNHFLGSDAIYNPRAAHTFGSRFEDFSNSPKTWQIYWCIPCQTFKSEYWKNTLSSVRSWAEVLLGI